MCVHSRAWVYVRVFVYVAVSAALATQLVAISCARSPAFSASRAAARGASFRLFCLTHVQVLVL